jgi:ferritin-like metal-binding protein YciE
MKLVSEKIPNLQALYVKQLRMLLSAEETIAFKMLSLVDAATDPELHQVLSNTCERSGARAARLRRILIEIAGKADPEDADPIKCRVVFALFDEAEDVLEDATHAAIRDVILIAAVQRIKHYEIAAYGTVRQFAWTLGRTQDAELLNETIHEEGNADHQLTAIADRINPTAQKAA